MSWKHNIRQWWDGFEWLTSREWRASDRPWQPSDYGPFQPNFHIEYAAGWNAKRFRWVYAINYGSRVILGGACVSWSRWFYLNRERYRAAKFMDRLLNHAEKQHGATSGPALWGTQETEWAQWGAVAGAVIAVLLGSVIVAGLVALVRWAL